MRVTSGEIGENKEVIFCKRDDGKRINGAQVVAESVHGMIRDLYDNEHKYLLG